MDLDDGLLTPTLTCIHRTLPEGQATDKELRDGVAAIYATTGELGRDGYTAG